MVEVQVGEQHHVDVGVVQADRGEAVEQYVALFLDAVALAQGGPASTSTLRSPSRTSRARQPRSMRFSASGCIQRDQSARGALPNMAPPSSFWLLPRRVVRVRMDMSLFLV